MTRHGIVLTAIATLALFAGTASAAQASGTLTVVKQGSGYVSSAPAGIDCGSDCSQYYPSVDSGCPPAERPCLDPQEAILNAQGTNGYALSGWTGCDSATGDTCDVTMGVDRTVHATFVDAQPPTVHVTDPYVLKEVGGTFTVTATATDNAAVARVEFRYGQTLLGADTTAPYTVDVDSTTVPMPDGQRTIVARAFDAAGNAAADSRVVLVDNTPPNLTLQVPALSRDRTVAVDFAADEPATVGCTVDGTPVLPCGSSSALLFHLADGTHTVAITATDRVGNHRTVSKSFEVDATAPRVSLDGPSGTISTDYASFAFDAQDAHAVTFECAFDGGPLRACTSPWPYVRLSAGAHSFDLVATDAAGNRSVVHRDFSVAAESDPGTPPPATDPPATTPPTTDPPEGGQGSGPSADPASGQSGDPAPGSADLTAPDTTITRAPAKRVAKRRVRFEFASTEAGSRFECSLDGATWSACTSPLTLKVKRGKHRLAVRAIDAAGNADSSPATASFRIGRRH